MFGNHIHTDKQTDRIPLFELTDKSIVIRYYRYLHAVTDRSEQRELSSLETGWPRLPPPHVTRWRPVIGQDPGHVTPWRAVIGRDSPRSGRAPGLLSHPNIRTAEILQLGEFTTSELPQIFSSLVPLNTECEGLDTRTVMLLLENIL